MAEKKNFIIDIQISFMYNTYCDLIKLQSQTCPLGGMVNTSPSQGEDYGFETRRDYQYRKQKVLANMSKLFLILN